MIVRAGHDAHRVAVVGSNIGVLAAQVGARYGRWGAFRHATFTLTHALPRHRDDGGVPGEHGAPARAVPGRDTRIELHPAPAATTLRRGSGSNDSHSPRMTSRAAAAFAPDHPRSVRDGLHTAFAGTADTRIGRRGTGWRAEVSGSFDGPTTILQAFRRQAQHDQGRRLGTRRVGACPPIDWGDVTARDRRVPGPADPAGLIGSRVHVRPGG
jgi:hypothetical protein